MVVVTATSDAATITPAVRCAAPRLGEPVPAKRQRSNPAIRQPAPSAAATVRESGTADARQPTTAVQPAASKHREPVPAGREHPAPERAAASQQRLPTNSAGRDIADAAEPAVPSADATRAADPRVSDHLEPVRNERHLAATCPRNPPSVSPKLLVSHGLVRPVRPRTDLVAPSL